MFYWLFPPRHCFGGLPCITAVVPFLAPVFIFIVILFFFSLKDRVDTDSEADGETPTVDILPRSPKPSSSGTPRRSLSPERLAFLISRFSTIATPHSGNAFLGQI